MAMTCYLLNNADEFSLVSDEFYQKVQALT